MADGRTGDDGEQTGEVLRVSDLTVTFPGERGAVYAVRGASWSVRKDEVLGIVGESGSGKSATGLAIMGLHPAEVEVSGSVCLRGKELQGLGERDWGTLRGSSVAMVFQDPMSSLNPVYSVGFQIAEAIRAHDSGMKKDVAVERAVDLLELVGIPNARDRVANYPHEFSGGMRQRVVIAIAMANNPDLIIADEPTTALDVTIQAQVLDSLRTARKATGAAAILITHDLGVVAEEAHRVAVMYAGRIIEMGSVDSVFYRPRMPYTLGLLGSLPRMDGGDADRLTPIDGTPPLLDSLGPGCPFAPRCPMSRELCWKVEPELMATDEDDHVAACHFSAELVGKKPADVFLSGSGVQKVANSYEDEARPVGTVVVVDSLVKHYDVRSQGVLRRNVGHIHAVCGVSFQLEAGETLGLVGESGSGKSTIAKLLMSLERPTAGSVRVGGATMKRGKQNRVSARELQMVFQDPMGSIDPRMNSTALVAEPLRVNGVNRRVSRERALQLLESVGITGSLVERYPHELSGGQRQRIGIARALALEPRALILDEPVSALDVSVQADVINLLEDLQRLLGLSYLFIAHDLSVVRHISDRVAVMYLGRIVEIGSKEDIFERHAHPYTEALIAAAPVSDPQKGRERQRRILAGEVPSAINPPSGCRFRTRCPTFRDQLVEEERHTCIDEVPVLVDRGQAHPVACHYPGRNA